MMGEVRKKGVDVVVTKDSRILNASVHRDAWRAADLTLIILEGKWGDLVLFEQARRLVWWWPIIARQAEDGPQGAAWRIGVEMREGNIRREFGG